MRSTWVDVSESIIVVEIAYIESQSRSVTMLVRLSLCRILGVPGM